MRGPVTLLGVACLLASSIEASAQNLLTNPSFTSSLSGWTDGCGGCTVFNGGTGNPPPGSGPGAATATYPFITAGGATALYQNLTSFPAGPLQFGGSVFIPSGQSVTVSGQFGLAYFSDAGCTILTTVDYAGATFTTNTWVALSQVATPTAGTQCLQFTVGLGSSGLGGTATYDDVFVQAASIVLVPTLDRRGLLLLALLLAGAGAMVLRRLAA